MRGNQGGGAIQEPPELVQAWRNFKSGRKWVSKQLHKSLVEMILEKPNRLKSWVGKGRVSYHFPILLQMEKEIQKPLGSFKHDHTWPEEEGCKKLVIQN